jgi:hypothetical protein
MYGSWGRSRAETGDLKPVSGTVVHARGDSAEAGRRLTLVR